MKIIRFFIKIVKEEWFYFILKVKNPFNVYKFYQKNYVKNDPFKIMYEYKIIINNLLTYKEREKHCKYLSKINKQIKLTH